MEQKLKSTKSKRRGWPFWTPLPMAGVIGFLTLVIVALIASVLFSGCIKRVNPPAEDRIYSPEQVMCPLGGIPIVPNGGRWENFVVVGKGRFFEDSTLLDLCEQRGLIERNSR